MDDNEITSCWTRATQIAVVLIYFPCIYFLFFLNIVTEELTDDEDIEVFIDEGSGLSSEANYTIYSGEADKATTNNTTTWVGLSRCLKKRVKQTLGATLFKPICKNRPEFN